MKAVNLINDTELYFTDDTPPLWAVLYGYCMENNQHSALFAAQQDNRILEFASKLPVVVGEFSIACGHWCARTAGPQRIRP